MEGILNHGDNLPCKPVKACPRPSDRFSGVHEMLLSTYAISSISWSTLVNLGLLWCWTNKTKEVISEETVDNCFGGTPQGSPAFGPLGLVSLSGEILWLSKVVLPRSRL